MSFKPSKKQYVLIFSSIILFVFYYIFWRTLNLSMLVESSSISLSILLVITPLLFISIIPSYVLVKAVNLKKSSMYVNITLFSLIYVVIAFVSAAILFILGI